MVKTLLRVTVFQTYFLNHFQNQKFQIQIAWFKYKKTKWKENQNRVHVQYFNSFCILNQRSSIRKWNFSIKVNINKVGPGPW